jgi:hypothetical protein
LFSFSACEKEDQTSVDNNSTMLYNDVISNYLKQFTTTSKKDQVVKILRLTEAIDYNTVKIYDLKTTEKLLIADLKSLKGFDDSNSNKVIFFLNKNKIVRSNIVTFKNKSSFNQYNNIIRSIWNMDKKKENYSGKVSFYTVFQYLELSDIFENGVLTENGIARTKKKKNIVGKTQECTDWYWITTYSDGRQTEVYLYTTCSCEEEAYRMANACGGGAGGGGTSSGSTGGITYPTNPVENQVLEYIDEYGRFVREIYKNGKWEVVLTSLSPVVVSSNPETFSYLIIQWPTFQRKVYGDGFVFTYDGGSGNWVGVPATDELIAQAIEDQIEDSQLDECTKGVLAKLKNLNQSDIANMIKRFSAPGSIFNINMATGQVSNQNNLAETKPVSGSNFDINMVFKENYINGFGNPSPLTDLSVATTMAHEVIHAYLISLLEENKTCGALGICDFPTVYDAYVQQQIDKDITKAILPDAHHELIAKNYVYSIASAIQEFHTGQSVDSGFPSQVYLDMAWGGLQGTYIFNKDYPDDPNHKNYKDRERIFARINTEKIGSQYGVNSPIGTPCKK